METEKAKAFKSFSEDCLKNNTQIALWDFNGEYYFADILLVGDEKLTIEAFAPKSKAGNKYYINWNLISKLVEYQKQ